MERGTKIDKLTVVIARRLIGKRIKYLTKGNITPRGNIYRTTTVTGVLRNNIEIGGSDWLHFSQIASIEII